MCGIAGEVGFLQKPNALNVQAITARLTHRGPDAGGLWTSPDGVCVLGHRRLSIIDLSPLGHQPMVDPLTGNAVAFNGEIYNFRQLRAECELKGDVFQSDCDTEIILALYRRIGPDCVKRFRGMFAISLWDASMQRLFLARDRVGKKPLHYALTSNGIIWASELNPLSRVPGVDRSIDAEGLELYLQLQSIPAPWTIYKGIRKLPPASIAIFDRAGLRIEEYWNVDYRAKQKLSESDALDGLEEKLTEAVKLRMISDVPLGALLSGGVDSSLVVALMSKLANRPVKTFSIGFKEEAFNELPYAEQAARICGADSTTRIVKGDVAAMLPKIARHYGEPFADSSAIPSFLVCEVAREYVTVVLNGDGGDELLGGYPRYWLSDHERFTSGFARSLLPAESIAYLGEQSVGTSLSAKLARRLGLRSLWPEAAFVHLYSGFWNDRERSELLGDAASPSLLPIWRRDWLRGAFARAEGPIDRMLWADSRTYLSDDLLVKMDIASMHVGLEARSPLLDHEVISFCASLEEHHKVKGGAGKYLLKKLAERHFPKKFVHRRKMGFGIPMAAWLRGPLRQTLQDTLLDGEIMMPLQMARIQKELNAFLAGADQHTSRIWALLMYGQWRLIDREMGQA
jgi:asparagine synthase (glutamine-hydrolysing)